MFIGSVSQEHCAYKENLVLSSNRFIQHPGANAVKLKASTTGPQVPCLLDPTEIVVLAAVARNKYVTFFHVSLNNIPLLLVCLKYVTAFPVTE